VKKATQLSRNEQKWADATKGMNPKGLQTNERTNARRGDCSNSQSSTRSERRWFAVGSCCSSRFFSFHSDDTKGAPRNGPRDLLRAPHWSASNRAPPHHGFERRTMQIKSKTKQCPHYGRTDFASVPFFGFPIGRFRGFSAVSADRDNRIQ